jgi:hypothetical protein
MDPASAAARAVDELTDVALPGLPMTDETVGLSPAATIDLLARLVCAGGLHLRWRIHYGVCDQCTVVLAVLTSLGFGDRIEEWSSR